MSLEMSNVKWGAFGMIHWCRKEPLGFLNDRTLNNRTLAVFWSNQRELPQKNHFAHRL